MVKTYKTGLVANVDGTNNTSVFTAVTTNVEYSVQVPVILSDLQKFDPTKKCRITLDYCYLSGGTLPDVGLIVSLPGKALANSYYNYNYDNTTSRANIFLNYDIVSTALTRVDAGGTNKLIEYTSPVNQPDHDFELLTTVGALTTNMIQVNFKTIKVGDNFTPSHLTALVIAFTLAVED